MSLTERYYISLAGRRLGAGALITDGRGRVLVVEPTYKPTWEIPGGAVEVGESPPAACLREIREELGFTDVPLGRLLVIDHQQDPPPRGDSLMLIYDLGVLDEATPLRLNPTELASSAFVAPDNLAAITFARLARRARAAVAARAEGLVLEFVDGRRRKTANEDGAMSEHLPATRAP